MASFDLHEESIYPGWMRACAKPSRFSNKYDIKKPMLSTDALSSIRKEGIRKKQIRRIEEPQNVCIDSHIG